jgi:hypothetical protein
MEGDCGVPELSFGARNQSLRNDIRSSARLAKFISLPIFWWFCFAILFAILASTLSIDRTFDFKNYHFYNGFSIFHDRRTLDIFPGQMQTTFFYGLDIIYYLTYMSLNNHPMLINVVLSLPYSVAALAVFLIARPLAESSVHWPNLLSAAAAVFGLTGVANLATLATTASDLVPGVAILIALARWVTLEKEDRNTVSTGLGVGALAGLSVALKLTEAPLFVAMGTAIAARYAIGKGSAISEALAFVFAGLVVFAAVDGLWLWGNAKAYGNPIFPLMNNVFKSDLVAPEPWRDLRFVPKTALMAWFYPAYWAFRPSADVSELFMRDPRILLGGVSAVVIVLGFASRWIRSRAAPPVGSVESLAVSLAIIFLVSYVLWEIVWSIYRYLAVQESLSGVLILAALPILTRTRGRVWATTGLFALVVVWAMRTTEYPWWDRTQRGPQAISVRLPALEANAMVLFLDGNPYAYLVPSMPSSARAIRVMGNLVNPGSPGKLWPLIQTAVRDHQGPLWGVEDPTDSPGAADAALGSLDLARDSECAPVVTNMELDQRVKICRLRRE